MNFTDRLQNGWRLLLNSFEVMKNNPRLMLFPAATAALTLVMAALFLTPIALQPTGHAYTERAHWKTVASSLFVEVPAGPVERAKGHKTELAMTGQAKAFAVVFYFLSMFLATFFNVAYTHGIFNALDGKPVSVGEGMTFALTKLKPILAWSLFAGLVGLLIKTLEQKVGFFGRMVVRLVGTAWSVAAVFVIPVLVLEEHPENPLGVIQQSAGVIKKTWGEALAGYAGLQIGGMIVGLSLIGALVFAGFAAFSWENYLLAGGSLVVWAVFAFAFSYVLGVASQIYLCVLYRYAAAGTVAPGYSPEMLTMAWRPRKS
jgi:hypothetical protein